MPKGDGGWEAMRLLWRATLSDAEGAGETTERERVSIEEVIRQAGVTGPLTAHVRRRIRDRLGELRLRWDSADALAEWLRRIDDWEWYGTLTFRDGRSLEYSVQMWRKWVDRINRRIWGRRYRNRQQEGVWGFVAFECQVRGHWHVHFVLAGSNQFDHFEAMKHWETITRTRKDPEGSYARIFLYDPARGGAGYCAKYVTKEAAGKGTWEIFGPWPPARWPLIAALA